MILEMLLKCCNEKKNPHKGEYSVRLKENVYSIRMRLEIILTLSTTV